jgi:hypothetical protein
MPRGTYSVPDDAREIAASAAGRRVRALPSVRLGSMHTATCRDLTHEARM